MAVHTSGRVRAATKFTDSNAGIGAQVHYIPVYRHVYYEKLGYKKGLCPRAETFAASEISLPVFPGLRAADQAKVARTLKQILAAL